MDDVLIYKQDVQKLVCRLNGCVGSKRSFNNCEKRCPDFKAIDELPIVQREQKTGRWIEQTDTQNDVYYVCSNCKEAFTLIEGTPTDNLYNYCPNCGSYNGGKENGGH